jgi:hypothetical protein
VRSFFIFAELMARVWQNLFEAIRRQRTGLAAALTVAVLLIGVFHRLAWPVLLGCGGALGILLAREYRKLLSKG